MEEHEYTYDKTMITSKTVIGIIKLANELALSIAPTRRKLCPAVKELAILNRDHKEALKTVAYLKNRRKKKT